jgi:predicted O-linked N-acetylglucosamine transferase (SPINDLY family)
MTRLNIDQAMRVAVQHHQAGRLGEAEQLYRQVLAQDANHSHAHRLLGVLAAQAGRTDVAVELLRRAIALDPRDAEAYSNLGIALRDLGKLDDARAAFDSAIRLRPQWAEAHHHLGIALADQGKLQEAVSEYETALRLRGGDFAEAHYNLGVAAFQLRRLDEAITAFSASARLRPDHADSHYNLGLALQRAGRLDEAIAAYWRAIQIDPAHAQAHNNLSVALLDRRRHKEALAAALRALELNGDYAEAFHNAGNANRGLGRLDEAIAAFSHAIRLRPDLADAHNNLGSALKEVGRLDEALASYDRAIALRPDDPQTHSNRVYVLHFHPGFDAAALLREQRIWAQRHAEPLRSQIKPHFNARNPDRRLRIGYVSPDFRWHPVGRFLLTLLEHHDHDAVEVVCYSGVTSPDAMTARFRAAADGWRDTAATSDGQLADVIREDRIDILVDLAMHMALNRLPAFARKPAPVQVTYMAYLSGTGLQAMDYRFSDPYLDPPGENEGDYVEESIRLPQTYWCHRPDADVPVANALPALSAGHATFGCLNNFCKITPPTWAAWIELLRAAPASRLLLYAHEGAHRQRLRDALVGAGIDPARLEFTGPVPAGQYFECYHRIDISLDPFPHGGGMTTFDSLWMGVPVVTLAGRTGVSRMGLSFLSNAGLPEWVARSSEQYVAMAAALAADVGRLRELRSTLRRRMLDSPLTNAPRFAQDVESAYRQMWRRWCAGESARLACLAPPP